jgi:transposase-like protein
MDLAVAIHDQPSRRFQVLAFPVSPMSAQCPVCRSKDIQFTSASPGDGRRKMVCRNCKYGWTAGKRGGYTR